MSRSQYCNLITVQTYWDWRALIWKIKNKKESALEIRTGGKENESDSELKMEIHREKQLAVKLTQICRNFLSDDVWSDYSLFVKIHLVDVYYWSVKL